MIWPVSLCFVVFVTSGVCENSCNVTFHRHTGGRPFALNIIGVAVFIEGPNNVTDQEPCVVPDSILKRTLDIFRNMNYTDSYVMGVKCRVPSPRVYFSDKAALLELDFGIYGLIVDSCILSWQDIGVLANFSKPKVIDLSEVQLVTGHPRGELSEVDLKKDFPKYRTETFRFTADTNYPNHYSTADMVASTLISSSSVHRDCLRCQMKAPPDAEQFKKAVGAFPVEHFPHLVTLVFSDIDLSQFKDFSQFGPINQFLAVNTALKVFPRWIPSPELISTNAVFSRAEQGESAARDRFYDRGYEISPDSPLLNRDSFIFQNPFRRLQNKYLTRIADFSINLLDKVKFHDGMERLEYIVLAFHFLEGSGITELTHCINVYSLDLSYNPLKYLPNNLFRGWNNLYILKLYNCSLESIETVLDQFLPKLEGLDLGGNPLSTIPKTLFSHPSLRLLHLNELPVQCLDIPRNNFSVPLTHLSMSNSYLSVFPAGLLTSAYPNMADISIRINNITKFGLTPLLQLDTTQIRAGERAVINLMFNCIEYIPVEGRREVETLDRVLNTFSIYLHHNPLHCGCEEMLAWLQSMGVINTFAIKCSPETQWLSLGKQRDILELYPLSRCKKYLGGAYPYRCQADIQHENRIKASLISIIGIIAMIAGLLMLKKYNLSIRMWLYTCSGWRLKDTLPKYDNYKYDAFVCYSNEDYRWVLQTLLPFLEGQCSPPYSLCIHDRDFVPGLDISLNVMNAMECSKAVILVLSPHSAQSEWCGFEINAAIEERVLRNKSFTLVPIIVDHVNLQQFSRKQRRVLKKIPYLNADDKHMMRKLIFFLGGRNRKTIQSTVV